MESPQPEVRDYILIEDIAPSDRPREKAMRDGIGSLSTAELVAIIFGNGMRGKSPDSWSGPIFHLALRHI